MYRFLLGPKWIGAFLLCVLAALVCVRLGYWQLDRLDHKRATNATLTAARQAAPVEAAEALSTSERPPRTREWAQVRAVGRYDADAEYLVRSRALEGQPGLLVLTPLRTVDGPTLWVVRGWLPAPEAGAATVPDVPAPPGGTVTVTGRVRPPESGRARVIQVGGRDQIDRIDAAVLRGTGGPSYVGYVQLVDQEPSAEATGLTPLPAPDDLDEGPHLAYAVQWFLFAAGFFVGYGVLARNRARYPAGPGRPTARDTPPDDLPSSPEARTPSETRAP